MTLAERLAGVIDTLRPGQRVLVAFDGPDAAGKTALASAVADRLLRPSVRASVDRWHNPRTVRLRRGDGSAHGYYLDSFDDDGLIQECLQPFASGAARVRTARFDHLADREVEEHQQVPPDAALLFDGVFLLRPELRAWWDLRVYLHVPEAVTLARAVDRDRDVFGGDEEVRRRYQRPTYRDRCCTARRQRRSTQQTSWWTTRPPAVPSCSAGPTPASGRLLPCLAMLVCRRRRPRGRGHGRRQQSEVRAVWERVSP